jgi:hypothetical protein
MSQPVDSEAEESRTRYFGAKRTLAATEGGDSSASTSSKRTRRSHRGPQNHRDFVPMGATFSNSGQMINDASSNADNNSDSSPVSAHDLEDLRTTPTDVERSTNGLTTTELSRPDEHPILGQNRLITGFAKAPNQASKTVEGETSEFSRNDSASHNSIGESADDAIEISDDTDMEGQSDDGGMMINVDEQSDDAAISNITKPVNKDIRQFRILGWTRAASKREQDMRRGVSGDAILDSDMKYFCEFLEKKSTPKHLPNLQILDCDRNGKWLIISVRTQDAKAFAALNGCKFAGKTITVQDISSLPSTLRAAEMSDGEIDEGLLCEEDPIPRHRKACSYCGQTNHKSKKCNQRAMLSTLPDTDKSSKDNAHEPLQGDLELSLSSYPTTTPITGVGSPARRLGDLSSDEFEKQIKYTLFHLRRDQIDLNRPAICTTCLQEGHQETRCPESICIHCGVNDEHPSRVCPKYRRCLKCRERGHDVDTCTSKLKNTTVPCDYCGSGEHLEDTCLYRYFPRQSRTPAADLKLWISCCICASKTHLVGDCPDRRPSRQATAWSLRLLDPTQISNLSLESGTRKIERDADIRGARQEGFKIKGRADNYGQGQPNRNANDNSSRRGGQDRFDDRDSERDHRMGDPRRDIRDDFYRPSSDSHPPGARYDRYESSYTDYRDPRDDRRDKFYATDSFGQRRRSRSPEFRNARAAQRHDTFQPPLPKEPLPTHPPPQSHQRYPVRGKDQGPPGVDSYRPMPSAAKKAWNKHRL